MAEPLLQIKDLSVSVEDKDILKNISLTVNRGETHVLMGPNGAGKSTLGNALMGNPNYIIRSGDIIFEGKSILEESVNERAEDGMSCPSRIRWRFRAFRCPTSSVQRWNRRRESVSVCLISERK